MFYDALSFKIFCQIVNAFIKHVVKIFFFIDAMEKTKIGIFKSGSLQNAQKGVFYGSKIAGKGIGAVFVYRA